MSSMLFVWLVLILRTGSEGHSEDPGWQCDECEQDGNKISCPIDTECELRCNDGNCKNKIINATRSTSLLLNCTQSAQCDGIVIYTPSSQSSENNANIVIHGQHPNMHSMSIYALCGFNTTTITVASPNYSSVSNDIIGVMYCGLDLSYSCNISSQSGDCATSSSQRCSSRACIAPITSTTTRSHAYPPNDQSERSAQALMFIGIAVAICLCGLCAAMCVTYHRTKEQFSHELKPASYSFEYNRQRTFDTDTTTGTTMSDQKTTRDSKSGPDSQVQDNRKQRFISLSKSNNASTDQIFSAVGSRSASVGSGGPVGSYAINRELGHIARESFTTTKEMWLESNGQLEIAETQKEKQFSLSLQPISALNEDEHDQDMFDFPTGHKDSVAKSDAAKTPTADQDDKTQTAQLEPNESNEKANAYKSWTTPTESEIENDVVMNSRYSAMQRKGAGHILVVSESRGGLQSSEQQETDANATNDGDTKDDEKQTSNEAEKPTPIAESTENETETNGEQDKSTP